jgi:glycosyltransferase involved in cell wall biosynthesis
VKAPRHVVLLSNDFRPMVGGIADHLDRLAGGLAERMPVSVMTSVAQTGAVREHAYELETLPPLPSRRLDRRVGDGVPLIRKAHTGAYFLALRRYAGRTIAHIKTTLGDDAAIAIGLWDTASHFWCDACRRSAVPYELFAYGAELLAPLYGRLPEWRRRDFVEAAHVIACSHATADLAMQRFELPASPAVVFPSVGPPPPADDIRRGAADLRRTLGLHDGPIVLSVGRLVPRKGFDLALRSLAALSTEYPRLEYLIIGDGPDRCRLESLTRELDLAGRVHFLGQVDEAVKWAAYGACDAFVMPNRVLGGADWEGFGIVFLEAALSRRPSIAGRTGGASDAVANDVTGLLVDPESPDELTGALRRLFRDDRLRDRLGRAGQEMARTRFTSDAAAQSLRTQLGWN